MEQRKSQSAPRKRVSDSTERKIQLIRIIILGFFLFAVTDSIGRWFVAPGQSVQGIFRASVWVMCLVSACVLFFAMKKPQKQVTRVSLSILYCIGFVVLLLISGFYRWQTYETVGYKISVTLMPAAGLLVELWHPRFLKWYGNTLKRIFNLDSIRNATFAIGILVFYGLVALALFGMHRASGWLSEYSRDVVQWITEGEINHNTDHREPYRNYSSLLNDLNDVQLTAAKKNGLKTFISLEEAQNNSSLHEIGTCDLYYLDKLTHSIPYLVPKAEKLLEDMGQAFQDSLYNRGYSRGHRFTVTSVLRTPESVKKLQKTNVNSSSNSCHCYGTTFDISYRTFHTPDTGNKASDEKMNQVLMQVAYDMRSQGRCYVKYEKQQTCLHITVR